MNDLVSELGKKAPWDVIDGFSELAAQKLPDDWVTHTILREK